MEVSRRLVPIRYQESGHRRSSVGWARVSLKGRALRLVLRVSSCRSWPMLISGRPLITERYLDLADAWLGKSSGDQGQELVGTLGLERVDDRSALGVVVRRRRWF